MLADIFGLDAVWAIVIIAILLFGGAAIPKLARSLGSAKTQFEKGLDEGKKAGADTTSASASADTPARPGPIVRGEGAGRLTRRHTPYH